MPKQVFIFGASKAGEAVRESLLNKKYEVIGFVDNDSKKWGLTLGDLSIYSPDILSNHKDVTVIIASMYYDEIALQLKSMGVKNVKNYYHKLSYGILNYNWSRYIQLFFYPLILLLTTPWQLLCTLWNSRIFMNGNWGDYNQYSGRNGIAYLFYRTAAMNLYRYGRNGVSPNIGTGNFKLSRWFHFSLPSLYIYWIGGPVALLLGIFGWLAMHLCWLNHSNSLWLFIVLGLSLISSTFYANGFITQNYNILGWTFFPLSLYALLSHNWMLAVITWILISFCSITVLFIGGIFSLFFTLMLGSLLPIYCILPAGIIIITHFLPVISKDNFKETILYIARAIGVTNTKTKYSFIYSKTLLCERRLFFLILYIQFFVVVYLVTHHISWLVLLGIIIFLTNSLLTRFADEQSIQMMMLSVATVTTLQTLDIRLLVSYWFLISPPPIFLKVPVKELYNIIPILKPFYIKPFIDGTSDFLSQVPPNRKVFIAFANPEGKYEKVFDPYQGIIELLTHVATLREINLIPNWHAVFENNYEGAPEFWGSDIDSVRENMTRWDAKYVIIYQKNNEKLDFIWKENGFKQVSEFHWNEYQEYLKGSLLPETENLTWWLLCYTR